MDEFPKQFPSLLPFADVSTCAGRDSPSQPKKRANLRTVVTLVGDSHSMKAASPKRGKGGEGKNKLSSSSSSRFYFRERRRRRNESGSLKPSLLPRLPIGQKFLILPSPTAAAGDAATPYQVIRAGEKKGKCCHYFLWSGGKEGRKGLAVVRRCRGGEDGGTLAVGGWGLRFLRATKAGRERGVFGEG